MNYLFLLILYNKGFKVSVRQYYIVVGGIILLTIKERKKPYYNVYKHVPKSYTKRYWRKHRMKEKQALIKGDEGEYPYNHRHSYTYSYW